ncbi:MAG TPA: hypothetical protein VG815_10825, partial [Chloroflexota bacterium]|nr:hypothetical protein [Chloroflexota bacterium]
TVQVEAVETLHVPSGTATGSIDSKNNIITISVPLSSVGSPAKGATLGGALFESDVQVGSPLYVADSQNAKIDYKIGAAGASCPQSSTPPKALPGAVATAGAAKNLVHYGGPVVHGMTNYLIFWLPTTGNDGTHPAPSTTNAPSTKDSSVSCLVPASAKSYNYEPGLPTDPGTDATYEEILEQYFKDLPGSSFYNLLTQYADQSAGPTLNSPAYGGVYFDTCGYSSTPASGTSVPGGTAAAPMYDQDIQSEVQAAMKVNGWQPGLDKQYFVFTGYDVASCFGPPSPGAPQPTCSVQGAPPAYCAYHGDFVPKGSAPILYANMADGYYAGTQTAGLCYSAPVGTTSGVPHQIGNTTVHDWAADVEVSITSHEQFETVNDPMVGTAANYAPPLGWYSSPNDQGDGEIGDKCAYIYGNYRPDGSNITLANGDEYIVQEEYSNWANGCSLGDSKVVAGTYGGAADGIVLLKGWNLINLPTSGIKTAGKLDESIESLTHSKERVVREIATFSGGRFNITIPGTGNQTLARNQGVFVDVTKTTKLWTPPGQSFTAPAQMSLGRGWNLIGAGWPNPGVMTDSMFNQIETENGSCTINTDKITFDDPECSATVSDIATFAPTFDVHGNVSGGQYLDWKPVPAFTKAAESGWVQSQNVSGVYQTGNQVPFTSGMWVHAQTALTWTPQGTECQSIVNGMCK